MEKPKLFEAAENRNRFLETAKEYQRQLGLKTQDWIVAKNLACLEFHCEAFCISDKLRHSRALAGFASLVRTTEYSSVEVSVKVEDGVAQAARFNLFCHPFDKAGFTSTILTFFDDVARSEEVHLDTGHIKELLDGGVDFGRVSRMVCGIDLRAERRLSRLKLWFFADNEPGRTGNPVEHALTMRGAGPLFRTLHLHPGLLFGYDLRFDGTTALKLYPDITGDEFASLAIRSRLSAVLSKRSLEAMEQANWTHLYLSSRNTDTMLQFHPREPDEFLAHWLPHPLARHIHRTYANCPMLDMVVSVPDRELERKAIENFALYYMPADAPQNFLSPA